MTTPDISSVRRKRTSVDIILLLDATGVNVDHLKAEYPDYELDDMWRSGELSSEERDRMLTRSGSWLSRVLRWFG